VAYGEWRGLCWAEMGTAAPANAWLDAEREIFVRSLLKQSLVMTKASKHGLEVPCCTQGEDSRSGPAGFETSLCTH